MLENKIKDLYDALSDQSEVFIVVPNGHTQKQSQKPAVIEKEMQYH